jgi:hypothetical protein
VIDKEFGFSLTVFILFILYGASNLYILVFLRIKDNYSVGLLDFLSIFMGNINNYKKLNKLFVKSFMSNRNNVVLNKGISIIHLVSPLLIPISIILWVLAIGLY